MLTEEQQKEILSKNLQYYIDRSGKEQKRIAEDLGIKPPRFNMWVRGKSLPPVWALKNVAEYFQITLSDLALEKPDMNVISYDSTRVLAEKAKPYLTGEILELIIAYSNAEEWKQQSVRKILDIEDRQGLSLTSQTG